MDTEHDTITAIRRARADLMTAPALPVTLAHLAPGDQPRGGWQCAGCLALIWADGPPAWTDAHGWLWCTPCASSDVIGAVLTRSEIAHLIAYLRGWGERFAAASREHDVEKCRRPVCDDCTRALLAWETARDIAAALKLAAALWRSGADLVPNPFGCSWQVTA